MFEYVPELIEDMKDDDIYAAPDILKPSSEVIYEILSENADHLSEYVRKLSWQNYFSEKVTGNHAIQMIRTAWKTSRNCFEIDKKANTIRYNGGQSYDADRIIKELPKTLEPRKSREWVIMNLDEARKFFGIDFKMKIWDKTKKGS